MSDQNLEKSLVYQVESDILRYSRAIRFSYRIDKEYLAGRAGLIRIINLILATISVILMIPGYGSEKLDEIEDKELLEMMRNASFTGYKWSSYTIMSIALGSCTLLISLSFLLLLFFFIEVRCDLLWERINQKAHIIACILSVCAAFCDVLSIQAIQLQNCAEDKCKSMLDAIQNTKHEEKFYPPYFVEHYTAFVGFLTNAMLYSVASRIWLRNDD